MYNHKNAAEVHYIHTSHLPGLYMDITDTTEPAECVANRRVTASGLDLKFPFSNIHALSIHFSTSCSTFSPFSCLGRYRKNSLVVTLHTSARDVFRKGLFTISFLRLYMTSAYPINHTLQPLGLTVDFLANRRYRHECGGLLLHWLLVSPFHQKTVCIGYLHLKSSLLLVIQLNRFSDMSALVEYSLVHVTRKTRRTTLRFAVGWITCRLPKALLDKFH